MFKLFRACSINTGLHLQKRFNATSTVHNYSNMYGKHNIKPFSLLFKNATKKDRYIFDGIQHGCQTLFFKNCTMPFIRHSINEHVFPDLKEVIFHEPNSEYRKTLQQYDEIEYSITKNDDNKLIITNNYSKIKEYIFCPIAPNIFIGHKA